LSIEKDESLAYSFPSIMQPKTVHNLVLFKITLNHIKERLWSVLGCIIEGNEWANETSVQQDAQMDEVDLSSAYMMNIACNSTTYFFCSRTKYGYDSIHKVNIWINN
jgi:hypothetical protein